MDRNEVIEKFFKELREKMPNREACSTATEEQLVKFFKEEVNYEELEEFLNQNDLKLSNDEIPEDLWFQLALFLILDANANDGMGFCDDEIWDKENDAVWEKLNFILDIVDVSGDISDISLSDFLKYTKSDKPDI